MTNTALTLAAQPAPLTVDADGVARVGGTRVAVDTVVRVFKQGTTAEQIVDTFSTLTLANVHATIIHHHGHESEVGDYLAHRQQQRAEAHELIEARSDRRAFREQLRACRDEQRNSTR